MKNYHFKSEQAIPISKKVPNKITSSINVQGAGGNVSDINVKVDIEHTFTNDLQLRLKGPDGSSILLVSGHGGSGDDFDETIFDDDAGVSIKSAKAPFRGIFRPEEALSTFHGKHINGIWYLEISDVAFHDGGSLNKWELEIITDEPAENTGPFLFHNRTPRNISPDGPNTVESKIEVKGFEDVKLNSVCVSIDIGHTFTSDLRISLVNPDGIEVLLVEGEGKEGNHFRATTFDDQALNTISGAFAPFTGVFRPEGRLSDFWNTRVNGLWTLRIQDRVISDGGVLNYWTLSMKSDIPPTPPRPFEIKVRFLEGLTDSQKAVFQEAAYRWSEVIVGNLSSVNTDIGMVDDLVIDAQGINIDGEGGVLGQAGPTMLRSGSLLPARGIMQFDLADLREMEENDELIDIIIHEMGHVLGIGTLWPNLGMIRNSGSNNPEFTGSNAMREYGVLKNLPHAAFVPIANTGGEGTRESHWRESVFDTELMTGYDDPGRNALSRLTIASLQDVGYQVDYNRADPFTLPSSLLSRGGMEFKQKRQCKIIVPDFIILPDEN